jgi:hypothetical protein
VEENMQKPQKPSPRGLPTLAAQESEDELQLQLMQQHRARRKKHLSIVEKVSMPPGYIPALSSTDEQPLSKAAEDYVAHASL